MVKKGLINKTHSADAGNTFVRSVLDSVGSEIGEFSPANLRETEKYFEGVCAYTGERCEELVLDCVIPKNKEYGGLPVMGNVVPVSKKAKQQKGGKSLDKFFKSNASCLAHLSQEERAARKAKIEKFQQMYYSKIEEMLPEDMAEQLQQVYKSLQNLSEEYTIRFLKDVKKL